MHTQNRKETKMFDAQKETKRIIDFIKDYFEKCHLKGIVIGISGGKDSAVAAALFSNALGPENVIGVTMPCHSKEEDREDAKLVAEKFGFKLINMDITNAFDEIEKEFAGKGYGDFKRAVADVVCAEMEPYKARYSEIIASGLVDKVLEEGAKKASVVANATLKRVQKVIGLYHK